MPNNYSKRVTAVGKKVLSQADYIDILNIEHGILQDIADDDAMAVDISRRILYDHTDGEWASVAYFNDVPLDGINNLRSVSMIIGLCPRLTNVTDFASAGVSPSEYAYRTARSNLDWLGSKGYRLNWYSLTVAVDSDAYDILKSKGVSFTHNIKDKSLQTLSVKHLGRFTEKYMLDWLKVNDINKDLNKLNPDDDTTARDFAEGII